MSAAANLDQLIDRLLETEAITPEAWDLSELSTQARARFSTLQTALSAFAAQDINHDKPQPARAAGDILANYRLLHKIGSGGMSALSSVANRLHLVLNAAELSIVRKTLEQALASLKADSAAFRADAENTLRNLARLSLTQRLYPDAVAFAISAEAIGAADPLRFGALRIAETRRILAEAAIGSAQFELAHQMLTLAEPEFARAYAIDAPPRVEVIALRKRLALAGYPP
jgi:hypothetical protein